MIQKASSPFSNAPKLYKNPNLRPYYFQESDMHLMQANHSDDDSEPLKMKETRLTLANIFKKPILKPTCNKDGSSLVEIYTPRSIKCYNISNDNSNDGLESSKMLQEIKFPLKSSLDSTSSPMTLTCDTRIKDPVARSMLTSFNLLNSKYAMYVIN